MRCTNCGAVLRAWGSAILPCTCGLHPLVTEATNSGCRGCQEKDKKIAELKRQQHADYEMAIANRAKTIADKEEKEIARRDCSTCESASGECNTSCKYEEEG